MTKSMLQLFSSADSRVDRVVWVADMTGTKALSERGEPEASLLQMAGWFFDIATSAVEKAGGQVIRYQEDALKAVFTIDKATEAVQAAINTQEDMKRGNQQRELPVMCAIGIATGTTVALPHDDVTGYPAVLARHLAIAASANAIFTDAATVAKVAIDKLSSGAGKVLGRTPAEYLGDPQRILLRGSSAPVAFHEVAWDRQLFGVKAAAITQAVARYLSNPSR